ncbi:MAG: F0F1 ATP synthase subunit epsilon [Candidatus Omnitrophica bacterium]|nr:F0F1 ATP synthase subunit epsilon [Candidatus Omnitrophota bacterium]MCB9722352.1 F0F1 ATP synthase subunit epsilon [Candidatus Omnitrophota bacterium]
MAKMKTGNFKCIVITPRRLLYEGEIHSLFLRGDRGEYEILPYHYPLMGVLRKGDIVINWNEKIYIRGGVIRFYANECTIMVEEPLVSQN